RLRHLPHGDRGLHPGVDSPLLQEVLERQTVHDGAEHADVIGPGTIHPPALQFGTPEEVPTAGYNGHLHASPHHLGDLASHLLHDVWIDAHRTATEGLA